MIIVVKTNRASMLFVVLVATTIFIMLISGAISLGLLQGKLNKIKVAKSQALHIAEAGVNYYRWVLYHDPLEYCNNETCKTSSEYGPYGPYAYSDSIGEDINGYYELYIIPPEEDGSGVVTIKSVGWVDKYPNIKRTIEVECSISSWSSFAMLSDSDVRLGEGTEVWGPIHSNGGIRFDGIAHGLVSSAVLDFDDPDHEGENEFGVHTHVNPVDVLPDGFNPPNNVPNRSDVFLAGRSFPVSRISFDLLDDYVNQVLSLANDGGLVLNHSGANGYHIILKSNNKMDIKRVNSLTSPCTVCLEQICTRWRWGVCTRYQCVDYESIETSGIASESNYSQNLDIPSNGIIFVKDNVWVDGMVNGTRVTILAFKDPITGNNTDIILNDNLSSIKDDDVIGLIAQRDIKIGFYSQNILNIDAAMIAKNGRVGRDYFYSSCGQEYSRNRITINGSIASRGRYGFSYTDDTGYQERNLIFNESLRLNPPPHFPVTGEYRFMSWRED